MMSSLSVPAALAASFALYSLGFVSVCALDHKHVRLVDYFPHSSNLLFRMGQPLHEDFPTNRELDYDGMIAAFKFRCQIEGIKFPDRFQLVDLSFIYPWVPSQMEKLQSEIDFFTNYPERGQLLSQPIFGINSTSMESTCSKLHLNCSDEAVMTRQPSHFNPAERLLLSKHFHLLDADDIFNKMREVRELLTTRREDGVSYVIFGHCECGCDRTGQYFGAYNMLYHGHSLTDVMLYTNGLEWGTQTYENQVALQWLCNRLYHTNSYRRNHPSFHNNEMQPLYDCDQCLDIPCSPPPSERERVRDTSKW